MMRPACALVACVLTASATAQAEDFGPDCWEGAPRSDDNIDCPLPLGTSDPMSPWDDLHRLGFTFRIGYAAPTMGGLGIGVRSYVARPLAFELGADVFGGVDPAGHRHTELPLYADAFVFFHRGTVVHGYALAGAGVSFARIQYDPEQIEQESYWGPRLGGGVQVFGARDLGWGVDLVGFGRIELSDDSHPISLGTLLRGSLTYYPLD